MVEPNQSILDCCCSCSSCRDIYLFWWLGGKTKGLLSMISKQKSGLFYMEKWGQNLISDPNYPKSELPHSTLVKEGTNFTSLKDLQPESCNIWANINELLSEILSELKQGSAQTFIKRFSVGLDLQFVVLGCKFECRSTHNRRSLDLEASSDC